MKAVVIYCSKSGVTEALAKKVSSDLGCDIIKIEPAVSYGNYFEAVARVGFEKISRKKTPYANILPDLSSYDIVIFGYPIWYSAPPAYAVSFMKNCDLAGKTIIPFSTSGGSPINVTLNAVRKINSQAKVLYPFNSSMIDKDNYDEWLKILNAMM